MLDSITNFLNHLALWIDSIPPEVWSTIFGVVLISPVSQLIKIIRKINTSGKMVGVVIIVSLVYSFVVYMLDSNPSHPASIAIQTALIYITAQPYYFLGVKKFFPWFAKKVAESVAVNEQLTMQPAADNPWAQ